MKYDFDSVIDRRNTNSVKWDLADERFNVENILPMWVADMDFRVPQPVIDALKRVAEYGVFGYSTVPQSYYDAVIDWIRKRHNWEVEEEWLVFTPGVIAAINILVRTFTSPGDQVIVQTPGYYPFFNAITNNDREIFDNPMNLENDLYVMDFDDLQDKINTRTKMIILCSPHNPVGRVWKEQELTRLGQLCLENDILVVSDDIHCDLVYDGFEHVPFASISKEFADRSVTCTSASKTFNLPGLKTSNIIIPNPGLREAFSSMLRSCGISSPNIFGIAATEAAYRYGEAWLEQLLVYLQGNMAFLEQYASTRIPGLRIIPLQGTYLAWLDFRGCGINREKLGNFVREDARVALQPGTIFGCREEGFERMNIACPRSTLEEGLRRIEAAVNRLRSH